LAVLPGDHFPARLHVVRAEEIVLASGPSNDASGYLQLRDLERRLVALHALGVKDTANVELKRLSRWIENPRAYAAISCRLAPVLRNSMIRQLERFRATDCMRLSTSYCSGIEEPGGKTDYRLQET